MGEYGANGEGEGAEVEGEIDLLAASEIILQSQDMTLGRAVHK